MWAEDRPERLMGLLSGQRYDQPVALVEEGDSYQKAANSYPNIDLKILWRWVSYFIVH